MKYLLLFFVALFSCPAFCQDIIYLRTGEEIQVQLTEIKPNLVKYKLYSHLDGPEYVVKKNQLIKIRFANGTEHAFRHFVPQPYSKQIISADSVAPLVQHNADNLYLLGQQDARMYYHHYEGAQIGTIVTTIVIGPFFGLIPAVACSTAPPTYHNLGFPDYRLMQQHEYATGYTNEARRIKSKKVWKGYGICALAYAALIAVVALQGVQ
jgi:hypothetical protein